MVFNDDGDDFSSQMTISHLCHRLSAHRCFVLQIDLRKVDGKLQAITFRQRSLPYRSVEVESEATAVQPIFQEFSIFWLQPLRLAIS